jgi:Bacterial low temperature requirement A protein (LtrA)
VGGHLIERFRLFFIIALGETVLTMGNAFTDEPFELERLGPRGAIGCRAGQRSRATSRRRVLERRARYPSRGRQSCSSAGPTRNARARRAPVGRVAGKAVLRIGENHPVG